MSEIISHLNEYISESITTIDCNKVRFIFEELQDAIIIQYKYKNAPKEFDTKIQLITHEFLRLFPELHAKLVTELTEKTRVLYPYLMPQHLPARCEDLKISDKFISLPSGHKRYNVIHQCITQYNFLCSMARSFEDYLIKLNSFIIKNYVIIANNIDDGEDYGHIYDMLVETVISITNNIGNMREQFTKSLVVYETILSNLQTKLLLPDVDEIEVKRILYNLAMIVKGCKYKMKYILNEIPRNYNNTFNTAFELLKDYNSVRPAKRLRSNENYIYTGNGGKAKTTQKNKNTKKTQNTKKT